MAGAVIDYRLEGFERVQRALAAMGRADKRRLLDGIGALIISQTSQRISVEKTAPDGTKWPEVSERYAQRKRAGKAASRGRSGNNDPTNLLQLTDDLRDSLTHNVFDDYVEIGSNQEYAATHQFGDPKRNIPARPFLGVSADDRAAIEDLGIRFVQGLIHAL